MMTVTKKITTNPAALCCMKLDNNVFIHVLSNHYKVIIGGSATACVYAFCQADNSCQLLVQVALAVIKPSSNNSSWWGKPKTLHRAEVVRPAALHTPSAAWPPQRGRSRAAATRPPRGASTGSVRSRSRSGGVGAD